MKHFLQIVLNIECMFLTAKVEIVQYPELIREPFGTSKDLTCSATGDPPPMITWIKDGTLVRRSQTNLTLVTNYTYQCASYVEITLEMVQITYK